ncbi:MAG: putative 6-phospho-beta-glucosidase [Firmicutes bacterium]|nr:putative 6-phospho-beta-glucosidase [Bacillota bacterium]
MKIAIIGGGSAYTPGLIEGLLKIRHEVPWTEICLMDIDRDKLKVVSAIVTKIVREADASAHVTTTLNRVEAITGSAFVLCQIRVGGLAGRVLDEKIPLKYGVIGQETVGPGGFAMALRTLPVMLEIARDIEKHAKEAWLINYANPSGMVAAVLAKFTQIKAVSICDVPIGIQYFLADAMGVPHHQVKLDYVGLNHLGWFRRIFLKGEDITPYIHRMVQSQDILSLLPSSDEKTVEETKMALRIYEKTKVIPSPYLQYYYLTRESLLKQQQERQTRGEVVQAIEKELLSHFAEVVEADDVRLWKSRGGAWHAELMVNILSSIHNDKGEEYIVNVINQGCVPGMAEGACVEIPCIVDKRGARPMPVAAPSLDMLGLMQVVAAYEALTVEAALEGSYKKALLALNLNPLVPSLEVAKQILDAYIESHTGQIRLS